MKKTTAIIIFIFIILGLSYMTWAIVNAGKIPKVNLNEINQDNMVILTGELSNAFQENKSNVVVYFKTDCQYCSYEIKSISDNLEKFSQSNIIFVSTESEEKILEFSEQFNSQVLNFIQDSKSQFKKKLRVKNYPSIFIFSAQNKLEKRFNGAMPIDTLISYVNNEQTN
ncbi:MAG: redoxin domain-containing protein [Bacteroidales bacterium]|nr:redoxin domain-containing protein [Bacteroidales bacterium]